MLCCKKKYFILYFFYFFNFLLSMLNFSSTIFAGITSLGGAVYVVRVSGSDISSLQKIIPTFNTIKNKEGKFVANIIDPESDNESKILDQALIVNFIAPRSFTGENTVEISLHGGKYIARRINQLMVSACGFRHADNGEFSRRAFMNGKIDLVAAEGICAAVNAKNEAQHKIASSLLTGKASKVYASWRLMAIEAMAMLEAGIDFPEDEIPDDIMQGAINNINNLKNSIEAEIKGFEMCKMAERGIAVALLGHVNAGKSSLINAITQLDVAIVSDIKGTTRDAVSRQMEIGGYEVTLTDTAGIRQTDDYIEQKGIERSLKAMDNSDIRLFVINSAKDEFLQNIKNVNIKPTDAIILNKIDLLDNDHVQVQEISKQFGCTVIASSALSGRGIEEIKRHLHDTISHSFAMQESPCVANDRHHAIMSSVLSEITAIQWHMPAEIIVGHLQNIAHSLRDIIGSVNAENILDSVFSKFCIGK